LRQPDNGLGSDPNTIEYDPDLWTDEFAFLSRPGQDDIQTDLFYDYRTNVASYPAWQNWLRRHQPPLLVIWGRYDPSFQTEEAEACRRDVPDAEVHVLDAGHFALDVKADEIAALTRDFLLRRTESKIASRAKASECHARERAGHSDARRLVVIEDRDNLAANGTYT